MNSLVFFSIFGVTNTAAVCILIWWAIGCIGYYGIFDKAGERLWKCVVPIVNEYTLTKLAWQGYVYWQMFMLAAAAAVCSYYIERTGGVLQTALLFGWGLCFAAGLVLNIKRSARLAECFGRSRSFAAGLVILPPVFMLLLGFGKTKYSRKRRL